MIKVACVEKKNWQNELNKFLLAYRSTPHTVIGESPAELLFGRKLRTKLPKLEEVHRSGRESEAKDRDSENKMKGKSYVDVKSSSETMVEVGDRVLVKQPRENKLSSTFEQESYTVTQKMGSDIVVERDDGRKMRRNSSFVKKYVPRGEAPEISANEEALQSSESLTPQEAVPSPRPSRIRCLQKKFNDFVLS